MILYSKCYNNDKETFASLKRLYFKNSFGLSLMIDGFHSDVIKLQDKKSEVLLILIYSRLQLKINRK